MLNIAALQGRLTDKPELKKTSEGTSVTSFTIANEVYGKKEANFIECVAWRGVAERMALYCEKGMMIAIDGQIQTRTFENRNGEKRKSTEVIVNNFNFCEKKKEETPYKDVVYNEGDLPY